MTSERTELFHRLLGRVENCHRNAEAMRLAGYPSEALTWAGRASQAMMAAIDCRDILYPDRKPCTGGHGQDQVCPYCVPPLPGFCARCRCLPCGCKMGWSPPEASGDAEECARPDCRKAVRVAASRIAERDRALGTVMQERDAAMVRADGAEVMADEERDRFYALRAGVEREAERLAALAATLPCESPGWTRVMASQDNLRALLATAPVEAPGGPALCVHCGKNTPEQCGCGGYPDPESDPAPAAVAPAPEPSPDHVRSKMRAAANVKRAAPAPESDKRPVKPTRRRTCEHGWACKGCPVPPDYAVPAEIGTTPAPVPADAARATCLACAGSGRCQDEGPPDMCGICEGTGTAPPEASTGSYPTDEEAAAKRLRAAAKADRWNLDAYRARTELADALDALLPARGAKTTVNTCGATTPHFSGVLVHCDLDRGHSPGHAGDYPDGRWGWR